MEEAVPEGIPPEIGQCRIEKKIGEGGMGSVYLGRHKTLDIARAIKLLPKHIELKDPEYSQRFFREARIAARLRHPNLVQVHECGAENEFYYLIMDYVQGPTCKELVEQKGRLPWREAVDIARQVALGLKHALSEGVFQSQGTPGNIIIDVDHTARLTDMGLAKETTTSATGLTRSGASLGTPYYMSPEQINSARDVGFQTDIYSLGATLYHMVCGTVPYTGTTFEVMTKQVREPMPPPKEHVPSLPDALSDVLRKMMAKSPENRYSDYDSLIQDFENLLAGSPVSAEGFRDQSMVHRDRIPSISEDDGVSLEDTHLAQPARKGDRAVVALIVLGVLLVLVIILLVIHLL